MPSQGILSLAVASGNDSDPTASAWFPSNLYNEPFDLSFGLVVSGTETWAVQHTFDDIQDAGITPIAFDNSSVSAAEGNVDGSYTEPVQAVRLRLVSAAASAAVSGSLHIVQTGY